VRLAIDFTSLAKTADANGRKEIANYLIGLEKSIVKKIPFLLEIKQYEQAFVFAMEGGDPNTINKVLQEMTDNSQNDFVIGVVTQYPHGKRMLRNFARANEDKDLIR